MRAVAIFALAVLLVAVIGLAAAAEQPKPTSTPNSKAAQAGGGDKTGEDEKPAARDKPKAKAPAKKKKKKKEKKTKEKPKEVIDLMLDVADTMCMKLGALVKRKGFSAEKRCDLLKFCIEDMAGMFDAMANELDLTQQDMVDTALQTHLFMNMQMNLKKAVKLVLQEKRPSEEFVSQELSRILNQWVLNVATQQGATSGGHVGKMSREAQKNFRAMGIGLPSYGQMDDDDLDEEDELVGDDYKWADQSNKIAELYDDDEDLDEDGLDGATGSEDEDNL